MSTRDTSALTNDEIIEALSEQLGPGWDDETDIRSRYGEDERPRVERVKPLRGKSRLPHAPHADYRTVSCLCSCHYVHSTACDEPECRANGKTLARYAERQASRKRAEWAREHGAGA